MGIFTSKVPEKEPLTDWEEAVLAVTRVSNPARLIPGKEMSPTIKYVGCEVHRLFPQAISSIHPPTSSPLMHFLEQMCRCWRRCCWQDLSSHQLHY